MLLYNNKLEHFEYLSNTSVFTDKKRYDIQKKYNLTDHEIFFIQNYIGYINGQASDHDCINKYLQYEENFCDRDVTSLNKIIDITKSAIQKFPKNSKTIRKVSKSTQKNDHIFQEMINNYIRKDKGFMSCSQNPWYRNWAIKNTRPQLDYNNIHAYVLEITNPTYLSQGYDISELSNTFKKTCKRTEEEVIFLPGFEGEIQDITTEQNITYITL